MSLIPRLGSLGRGAARDAADGGDSAERLGAEIAARAHACRLLQLEGGLHPDRLFYVIFRGDGGMFSLLSSVLGHLTIADALGATPVVDMENFQSTYSETEPVHGSRNAWTYYFEPVSDFALDDVYASANVLLCSGGHPVGTTTDMSTDPQMLETYDRYVRLNRATTDHVEAVASRIEPDVRTLGVHFRGQEQRTAPAHPLPPTEHQMITLVRRTLDTGAWDRIYLLTEREEYLRSFRKAFGDRLVHTDSYRGLGRNAYTESPRPLHRYRLGLEVLTDTIILSRCGGLLCGNSNVSEAAIMLNRGRYSLLREIDLGLNVGNRRVARVVWTLKRLAPEAVGGFPREVSEAHLRRSSP